MDILIGLVIAMFIITAVYVGYHAMQQPVEEGEGHNVELDVLNENTGIIQATHNSIIFKVII